MLNVNNPPPSANTAVSNPTFGGVFLTFFSMLMQTCLPKYPYKSGATCTH